ncbi:Retinol dehydrogenase 12 [Mycena kentingensis (nom. inval.)]|nr:Retinol dehydrogenase 12 [Mycena kentingensis (nom. inval.)]
MSALSSFLIYKLAQIVDSLHSLPPKMRYTISMIAADQWSKTPRRPVFRADLSGKTVLVVGANTGLGLDATKHFATMGPARLILACRSQSRGKDAIRKLVDATGYTKAELWLIDLGKYASVKAFADKWDADGGRLDVLVMNAGLNMRRFEGVQDNMESSWALFLWSAIPATNAVPGCSVFVNNVATPLTVLRLLPSMARTAQEHGSTPRIVVVSSDVHYLSQVEKHVVETPNMLQTLLDEQFCKSKDGGMGSRYPPYQMCVEFCPLPLLTSRHTVLNVFFTRAFASHLGSTAGVTTIACNPGYCYSQLRRNLPLALKIVDKFLELTMALPTEIGARQIVWAALAQENAPAKNAKNSAPLKVTNGAYVSMSEVREVSDYVLSEEGQTIETRLWSELIEILSKADSKIPAIVETYLQRARI